MSDQQAPPNGDTPAVAGPTEAPGTAQDQPQDDSVSYEQRYKDLQAEYTRSQQENSQFKQREEWAKAALTSSDPDIQRQAFDILGIEYEEEPEQDFSELDEFTDEDPYDQRIRALEERLSQQQQEEQSMMADNYVVGDAREQVEALGLGEASDGVLGFIFNHAQSLPRLPLQPGEPAPRLDMKAAAEQWQALMDEEMRTWAKTKRAPYVSPGGLPANEVPDPGHGPQARINRALQSLRNNMGDE